jgi:nucleotide-binding universal stress UspA family protein
MEVPIRDVVVPVAPSAPGHERAVGPALRLAARGGGEVCLFACAADEGAASGAERHLRELADGLPGRVSVEVVVGRHKGAAASIAAAAERRGATICMAAHGRSGVGRALLGSVTEETLQLVDGPLVLVGPRVSAAPEAGPTEVVACVDGSSTSEQVVPVAAGWAAHLGARLVLAQVLEPASPYPGSGIPEEHLDGSYLERLAAGVQGVDRPDFDVLHGDPASAIVEFASGRVQLIAVATHAHRGLTRAALGSVAMKVVHRAPCPVLVVRQSSGTGPRTVA